MIRSQFEETDQHDKRTQIHTAANYNQDRHLKFTIRGDLKLESRPNAFVRLCTIVRRAADSVESTLVTGRHGLQFRITRSLRIERSDAN